MTGKPMTKKMLMLAAVAAAGACDVRPTPRPIPDVAFCRQVLPAVDSFVTAARVTEPEPDDPRYGGTAVVGGLADLSDGMNVAVSADFYGVQHQQFVNLMTLIRYDANLDLQPYLASSWDVADDNTSVTFHLRDDVVWHDGERTDAHDVAFTYRTVTNPVTAFPNAAFWNHYVKGPDGVEVVDDLTVRIHMEPHAEFLDPFRVLAILPEHLLGDVPPEQLRQHPYGTQCPVGNGPFVFYSHATQDRWVFEANPAFPRALGGRPFLDRYVYRVIPEQTTLLTELLTQNVDVYLDMLPDQARRVVDDPGTELVAYPSRAFIFVVWNARRPVLSDARVRRAITMGTDRESIVDAILQGYGTVAHSGVPPFHWAFDEERLSTLEHDPEAARALLEEAGWTDRDGDGVRESAEGVDLAISIKYNTGNQLRQNIAEIMQSQLTDIGVAVRPEVVEWATLLSQINAPDLRDFDGVVMGLSVEFRLDDTDLFHSERFDQPYAWSGTRNPEIDRLLEELSLTVDRDRARDLWVDYQNEIIEEQPYTYFYFRDRLIGVTRRLEGVEMDQRGPLLNLREWYVDPESR